MENYVKIENNNSLVRDMTSGAVINTNREEYENYVNKRKLSQEFREKIKKNSDDIQKIKSDVTEIKNLLIALMNKGQ